MSNFSGGCEHHSQADALTHGIEVEKSWCARQHFIEYRLIDGKWQARVNHFTTPQQALEEKPVEWQDI